MVEDEQSTLWLSWRDDQFIAQVGFLSTMNALAYFSKSPFFQGIPDQQSMLSSHKTKRLYVYFLIQLASVSCLRGVGPDVVYTSVG